MYAVASGSDSDDGSESLSTAAPRRQQQHQQQPGQRWRQQSAAAAVGAAAHGPVAAPWIARRRRHTPARRCFEPWMWLPLFAGVVALVALAALVLGLYASLSLHALRYELAQASVVHHRHSAGGGGGGTPPPVA